MKKIFGLILVAATVFVGCQSNNNVASDNVSVVGSQISEGPIAYINMDSLVSSYNMYLDLRASYETKANTANNTLTAQARKLEKDVVDYQEKIQKGLVTRSQAATMEETLTKQQQDFIALRDKTLQELAEEEQVLLNQIQYSIIDFLKVYNKDNRYSMILSTSISGPVLNADPALDITKAVLVELNKNYVPAK